MKVTVYSLPNSITLTWVSKSGSDRSVTCTIGGTVAYEKGFYRDEGTPRAHYYRAYYYNDGTFLIETQDSVSLRTITCTTTGQTFTSDSVQTKTDKYWNFCSGHKINGIPVAETWQ